jgi:hypothetical protein
LHRYEGTNLDDLTPQDIESIEKQLAATLKKVEGLLEHPQSQAQDQQA